MPYVVYLTSVLVYYTHIMIESEDTSPQWNAGHTICRVLIFLLSLLHIQVELTQLKNLGWSYFDSILNLIQITSSVMNLVIVSVHSSGVDYDVMVLTKAASMGAFMMWLIFMSWMRLFD